MSNAIASPYSFSPEVRALLEQAGWYDNRIASPPPALPYDVQYPPAIHRLLMEFGGLSVESSGPGVNKARNSIEFDPLWAEGESTEDGRLTYYSSLLGSTLYPIGQVSNSPWMICLDLHGKVYMAGDCLFFVGESFVEGVSNMLLGIRGKVLQEETKQWIE